MSLAYPTRIEKTCKSCGREFLVPPSLERRKFCSPACRFKGQELTDELPHPNPSGLCQCGCGQPAPIADQSERQRGWVKGKPKRYIAGHQARTKQTVAMPRRFQVDASTGCWNWTGRRNSEGYGLYLVANVRVYAHRASYEAAHGSIPNGHEIHHVCANKRCVNPAHLQAVTRKEHVALDGRRGFQKAGR
jgi:hypothetical protein